LVVFGSYEDDCQVSSAQKKAAEDMSEIILVTMRMNGDDTSVPLSSRRTPRP
jgi:hypothetical protein